MAEQIDHWRVYDPRSRRFIAYIPRCSTRAEAEKRITALTAGRRNNRANILRMSLAAVPVLKDGTSPRAEEWQAYYDEMISDSP